MPTAQPEKFFSNTVGKQMPHHCGPSFVFPRKETAMKKSVEEAFSPDCLRSAALNFEGVSDLPR